MASLTPPPTFPILPTPPISPTTEPKAGPGAGLRRADGIVLPDIDWLRCGRAESQFRNVYRSGRFFVGKVKEGGRLRTLKGSRSPHAGETAAHVAAWYALRFGPRWREAVANRKRRYWRISYSGSDGGYVITVWANGSPVPVCECDGRGRLTRRPLVFGARCRAFRWGQLALPALIGGWAAWRS